ncbi:hypothetical protein EIP91_003879 [Steccherinum ochraceum]|uniref:DUF6533 domain-containing protein n=1 Tax=Steccherinum ochraceum TaxID=92696 RepID=A0A4R0RD12_9APHY|nr:hypothetical protein EIP91_003879 [Steccherinum ochraceum]
MGETIPFTPPVAYQFAALCLVAYDTLLTFSREVECIWKRKLNAVTALYVLQRWVLILDGMLINLHTTKLWECRHFRCKSQVIFAAVVSMLAVLGVAAFSTLRIWAIWGHALVPTLTVALASAIVPAVNLYSFTQISSFVIVDGICSVSIVNFQTPTWIIGPHPSFSQPIAIVTDVLVLVLTWIKTADVWRESKRTKRFEVTVSTLLLRDGTMYFGMALIANIVALIFEVLRVNFNVSNGFVLVLYAASANLLARFMLDLRGINEQASSKPCAISSISFNVQSLGGNIGAPLRVEDSTWVTGPADDVASESDMQYEETMVPFRAGLRLDIAEVPLRPETINSSSCEASGSRFEYTQDIESRGGLHETARDESSSTTANTV